MSRCEVSDEGERVFDRIAHCVHTAENDERVKECTRLAEMAGLEKVGEGGERIAFSTDDGCVVKMGKSLNVNGERVSGRFQNLAEVHKWETMDDEVRDRFVPIEDYDEKQYAWVTMPEVGSVATEDSVDEFEEEFRETGWECADITKGNVGDLDGERRLLDYGGPCRRIDSTDEA